MKIRQDRNCFFTLISSQLLFQKMVALTVIGVFSFALVACDGNNSTGESEGENLTAEDSIEERLILENATLNQVDSQGKLLWKLDVNRVVYRQDEQNAQLEKVTGEFYQNGQVFLQIEANQGRILQDGQQIDLEGNVVATDPRNGAVLRSNKLEWLPQENLLVIPQKVTGNHPRFEATADQGKYYTDREELELIGNVEGVATDPPLNLKGEQLNWLIPQEIVKSEQPLNIDRYDPETENITDTVTANEGEANLREKTVVLENNVAFSSNDPPLQATSNLIRWEVENKRITSNRPIKLVNTEDKITLTGNQGEINLNTEIAQFEGDVKGISNTNQATLFSNRLRWNLSTQKMEAEGNVIYQQDQPPLTSRGDKAMGILQQENIIVKGNQEQRVVTEIVP